MERLKDKVINGVSFEIISEECKNNSLHLIIRVKNSNNQKKNIELKLNYISQKYGLKIGYNSNTGFYVTASSISDNTFVDLKVFFQDITSVSDGDRIEMEIDEGKFASLKLVKEKGVWMVSELIDRSDYNRKLKNRIEHFEAIEEQFGITLQNFSVNIKDEHNIEVFCEVLAINGENSLKTSRVNIAIYDINNDIVYTKYHVIYASEFKGFAVLTFDFIKLDISVDGISKIRIFPS